jgi:hypothetical protein
MNFCFSVAILLGAVNATNELDETTVLQVELDEKSQQLLQNDAAAARTVKIWYDFFRQAYPEYREKLQAALESKDEIDANLPLLRFQFQQELWKCHTSVIETAISSDRSNNLLQLLPEPERNLGIGWSRMVDVLAASTFPTDLMTLVEDGAGFLPYMIITDQVVKDWKSAGKRNNSRSFVLQNHRRSVQTTFQLVKTDDATRKAIARFWARVVRRPHASREMPGRVNRLVHGSILTKLKELFKVIALFLRP